MIRVTLELISAIDAERDRLLGVAYIANEGTTAKESRFCTYSVRLSKNIEGQTDKPWKQGRLALRSDEMTDSAAAGRIEGFDRVQRGAWDLLYLCLQSIVGARNVPR